MKRHRRRERQRKGRCEPKADTREADRLQPGNITPLDTPARHIETNPLEEAYEAAREGDPVRMVEILLSKGALAGIRRYQTRRWRNIPAEDQEHILACSVTELFWYIKKGKRVENLLAWLIKVSDRLAFQFIRRREADGLEDFDPDVENIGSTGHEEDSESAEPVRDRVLRLARGFLPRLGHETAQRVMAYLFDAVEAGEVDISKARMAKDLGLNPATVRQAVNRGFQRLKRIALEEGYGLPDLAPEEFEEPPEEGVEQVEVEVEVEA